MTRHQEMVIVTGLSLFEKLIDLGLTDACVHQRSSDSTEDRESIPVASSKLDFDLGMSYFCLCHGFVG